MSKQVNVGDKVEIVRGRKVYVGIVSGFRTKVRGKKGQLVRKLQAFGIDTVRYVEMAIVSGDGWRVDAPLSMCKVIGKTTKAKTAEAARNAESIKQAVRNNKHARSYANSATADAAGLYELAPGAEIEVQFSDAGWLPAKFVGIIRPSQRIRYERNGRVRATAPQFVRIKK